MTKRNMWTDEETLEMLNVMLEQETVKAMNGRPFRKDKAFRLVFEEMMQRGYNTKDPKQIENRWKNLKKRYMDLQKEPNLAESNSFLYYDEVDVLLKGKPPATESTLYELSITRVDADTEDVLSKSDSSPVQDDSFNEDDNIRSVEVDPNTVVESTPQPAKCSSRRFKRNRKRSKYTPNEAHKSFVPPYRVATEQEAYRNQKKLIDYQFELYSKAQEKSDQKFLDMTREMLNECNEKFQSFVNNLL